MIFRTKDERRFRYFRVLFIFKNKGCKVFEKRDDHIQMKNIHYIFNFDCGE